MTANHLAQGDGVFRIGGGSDPDGAAESPADWGVCRFVLDGSVADSVFREWLAGDIRAARLSAAYRAYYRVRGLLPIGLRQFLQRRRRSRAASDWYYPQEFIESLTERAAACGDGIVTISPWPDGAHLGVVLTHDVETAEGMRRIAPIADLEESLGFRSSWNIVPHKYPIDRDLLADLRRRGFEIGVHGYNHDGKLFASRAEFDRRAPRINDALRSLGAVGFRAPMVHRNLAWMQSLEIEYDASCFDSDPFQAMPGGVGGVWPFVAGRFVELPYTLPQDHTLLVVLGERDGRIWSRKLNYLARLRGMALLLTHPDYLDSSQRFDVYHRFLDELSERDGIWRALPREVASWWRERDQLSLHCSEGKWSIQGAAADRAHIGVIGPVDDTRVEHRARAPGEGTAEVRLPPLEWSEPAAVASSVHHARAAQASN